MNPEEIKKLSFGDLLNELIHYLEDKSYTQLTLVNYRRIIRKIEPFMIEHGINTYTPEIGMQYYAHYLIKNKLGTSYQKAIRTAIRRFNDFYYGMEYRIQQENQINLLSDKYEHVLEMFSTECAESGNKDITIESKKRFVRSFLKKCITLGCPNIQSLNPSYVTRACLALENKDGWAVVRRFLKSLSLRGTTKFDFSTIVPRYRRSINIPITYSEEEILRFERAINRTNDLGKRNYAMLLLATRLGMRSGDIAKLSLDELDFKHEKISLIQQKNGEMLHLPMLLEVRKALTDYINNARPRVTSNTVFLRHNAPYQGITTSVLRFETSKYFSLADVDISGKKHWPHTFRSSLASSMVNNDIPYEAVRTILGHSDPDAIKHYAKLDIEKLRECAIEVPRSSGSFKTFLDGGGQS
ncbi:tyrosine-type recombinase/integrase [Propionispira raffinosivorans]|uniref:tyrosine-type recombinase/integrase n=1 Tax=Propionispira raffinosivorans TaxID=86959 RepID=UPI00037A478E|nr:tyrosine-type recombinase/integrase [Propionispira raffinosivorans]